MKRYGWLYEQAFTKENIRLAIHKASKGKKNRKVVQKVLANEDKCVEEIFDMMWNGKFIPSPYKKKTIIDGISGKQRELSIPKFYPDHIVHWCVYLVLYPVLTKSLIHNTCASLKGRGQVYGKNICAKKLKNRSKTKYYLKIDIKKFYPSVDNDRMMELLERKIKDTKLLDLIKTILDMEKGLPIGMILSQLFANYYLVEIDHYFEKYDYVRYADDIVMFLGNKRELHMIRSLLNDKLEENGLHMKPNYQIYKTSKEMLDFMGYRMNADKVILRKSILYRLTKRVRRYRKHKSYRNACAIMSYMGWIKNSNNYSFYLDNIKPQIDFAEIKEIIRKGKDENLQERKQFNAVGMGYTERYCIS